LKTKNASILVQWSNVHHNYFKAKNIQNNVIFGLLEFYFLNLLSVLHLAIILVVKKLNKLF